LCNKNGVRGYPTIKYGDPSNLQDYKGGRSYDALKKFADENLGPSCGPAHLELCDEEMKTTIGKYQAMPAEDLDALIKEKQGTLDKLETDFKSFVEGLNTQYKEKSSEKDEASKAPSQALGIMKSVQAYASKKKEEL